jgi:uncharacterized membrane-anchored protein YhcB (DUF1043 family)
MKTAAMVAGIVVGVILFRVLRRDPELKVMEEKIHDLQDHFRSLDAEVPAGQASRR